MEGMLDGDWLEANPNLNSLSGAKGAALAGEDLGHNNSVETRSVLC